MKNIFLLQEVIDDLVNTDKGLFAPLFKLNYFGKLIENAALIKYTNNEINGYGNDVENIPEYRKAVGTLYVDIQIQFKKHTVELPASMLPEPYKTVLKYNYIRHGVANVEKLARDCEHGNTGNQIATLLPMEMFHVLQPPIRELYRSDGEINVTGAKLSSSADTIISMPNAIRTILLDFVMSIAKELGYKIEIESFNKKTENNQAISYYMKTIINNSGDGNVINTGDKNHIESNVTLYKNDAQRLSSELNKHGIDEEDIKEIVEIVDEENPNEESGRLGEKANGWISKIINKSLNGVGKIGVGVSANLLAGFIKHYYGMPI